MGSPVGLVKKLEGSNGLFLQAQMGWHGHNWPEFIQTILMLYDEALVGNPVNKLFFSNEDMILALVGQFKQLSHKPEKFRWLNGIRTHDLCDACAGL